MLSIKMQLILFFVIVLFATIYYIIYSKNFREKNLGLIFTSFLQGIVLSVIFPNYLLFAPILALVYYLIFYNIWNVKFLLKSPKLEKFKDEDLIQLLKRFPKISHLKFKFRKYSGENSLNANVIPAIPLLTNEYKISFGDKLISKLTLEEKIVVLAHEIGHILKKHIWVQGILQAVLFVVLVFFFVCV